MGLIAISSMVFLGGMYLMIAFAWWLLQIIANWRIFTKAGEAGWKSIIPIYGDYISYKIAWQPAYFWLTLVLGIVSSCLQGTLETNDSLMISMSIVLIKIILAIISIMYSVKLARAFGRGTGFAIGLIFLQPIFMLILGLAMTDIMGQINKYILNGKSPELTFRGFLHIYRLQFIIEFCCQNILLPFHSKNQNCQSTGADR